MEQRVLPVIKDWKQFDRFIDSELTWGILLGFHINFLADLFQQAHAKGKKLIVHMDLTHGLANDPFGAQYLIQSLRCDGIISTKGKVIECAKKHHCLSILRLFLIDSDSVEKGCALANKVQSDYLELLPALCIHGVERVRQYSDLPLIGGGLLSSIQDIDACLAQGMCAVTTSNFALCEDYMHKRGGKG